MTEIPRIAIEQRFLDGRYFVTFATYDPKEADLIYAVVKGIFDVLVEKELVLLAKETETE